MGNISNWDTSQAVTFTSPWAVENPASNLAATLQTHIKDTLESGAKIQAPLFKSIYVAEINKPQLEQPVEGAGAANARGQSMGLASLSLKNINTEVALNQISSSIEQFKENIKQATPQPNNPLVEAIEQKVNSLSDVQLEKMDSSKTPEQVRALLLFAIAHPDAAVSKDIRIMAAIIIDSAQRQTGLPFEAATMQAFDMILTGMQKGVFTLELEKLGLSAADKKLLTLAASLPALAKSLPPELKEVLATLVGSVNVEVGLPFGIPTGWQFDNSAEIELMEGARFDQKVVGQLQDQLEDGQLTPAKFNELRSAYYLGQEGTNPALKEIVQKFQAADHIPPDYRFPIDKQPYLAMLDGATFASFKKNIESLQPPPTVEQQAQLMAALGAPAMQQNLPVELKAVFNMAKAAAIGEVSAQYKLPQTWQPSVEGLSVAIANVGGKEITLRQDAINTIKDMSSISFNLANAMLSPKDPLRMTITNYMGLVSAALIGLQDQLYSASAADASVIRRLNMVQRDTTTTKLEKQRQQLEDVREAKTKQQIQAVAGQYGIIASLIAVMIIMPFLIPVLIGVMIGLVVGMIVNAIKGGGGLSATRGPLTLAAEGLGLPMKALFIMLSVLCPFAMILAGLMDLMFTGGKGVIEPCLKAYGVPKSVIDKLTMALQMITIVAMILAMVACYLIPGLQPIAAALTNAIASAFGAIGAAVASVVSMVGRTVKTVIDAVIAAIRLAGSALVHLGKLASNIPGLGPFLKVTGQGIQAFADEAALFVQTAIREGKNMLIVAKELMKRAGDGVARFEEGISKTLGKGFSNAEDSMAALTNSFKNSSLGKALNPIGEAASKEFEAIWKLIKSSWDDLLSRAKLDKTPELRALDLQVMRAEMDVSNATKALNGVRSSNSADNMALLDGQLKQAELRLTSAQANVSAYKAEMDQMMNVFVTQVETLFQAFPQVVQAVWGINNKILQGQIALIKSAFEAYAVETEATLKILQATLNKMMAEMQDMGEMIKKLIAMQEHMMKGMSESMTRLSSV